MTETKLIALAILSVIAVGFLILGEQKPGITGRYLICLGIASAIAGVINLAL